MVYCLSYFYTVLMFVVCYSVVLHLICFHFVYALYAILFSVGVATVLFFAPLRHAHPELFPSPSIF